VIGPPGAAGGDTRWTVFKPVPLPQTVTIRWDEFIPAPTGVQLFFGPYFAVEAYDFSGGLSNPLLIGSAGIDSLNGTVLFQETGTGFLTPTGATATFDAWHNFRMVLNYNGTGGGNYQVFFDNALVRTEGFVDPGIFNFTAAPIAALAFLVPVAGQTPAYFDNYSITVTSSVPEPASLGLTAVGLAALACRRGGRTSRP
jgi:hypothetical protein